MSAAGPILVGSVKPAKAGKRAKSPSLVLARPSADLRSKVRDFARQMLKAGYRYSDTLELLRVFLIDEALQNSKGDKTAAGETLGLSREYVRKVYARGEQVLKI